jgi:hypothetical protein
MADRMAIVLDGRLVTNLKPSLDFDRAIETMIGRALPEVGARQTVISVPSEACALEYGLRRTRTLGDDQSGRPHSLR